MSYGGGRWETCDDFLFDPDYDFLLGMDFSDYESIAGTDWEPIADYAFFLDRVSGSEVNLPTDLNIHDPLILDRPPVPMILVQGKKNTIYNIDLIPVSISTNPVILNSLELIKRKSDLTPEEWDIVIKYISYNSDVFLSYWNKKSIDGKLVEEWDLSSRLRSISN